MKRKVWTQEEIDVLLRDYPTLKTCEEIAKSLGRTQCQVYNKALSMGLRKPKESFVLSGSMGTKHPKAIASRFTKGHIPANKGKKMDAELYDKVKRTMFQKGHTPVNYRPVGSERVNVDGYLEIKVADPKTWRLKQRVVWESVFGEIPPGCNIQFKNHDRTDCRIENLYLISKAEQMRTENSMYAKYPKELQDVIRLKGAIKRQIRKRDGE